MSLTMGAGPFGPQSPGTFNFQRQGPAHVLYWEPVAQRVRGTFAGETVVDTTAAMRLHETGLLPTLYFPAEDVRSDVLVASDHSTHCPFKGDASYRSLRVGDREAANAVWTYEEPLDSAPPIAGYLAFYPNALDAWFEEDQEVFAHFRDPYHRVDVLDSSRSVRVSLGGYVIAETTRPRMVFETGLPPRAYIPPEDVASELLTPSDTRTGCPYKGQAAYWSAVVGGQEVADAAWSYSKPLPDGTRLAGYLSFADDKVSVEVGQAGETVGQS
ncbi:MAG: DUF427 domain-containing protein [Actinomycetota bacterium]|nr:DUF427 domain-containing protein [Actinomycetota bacterium]